MTKTEQTLLNRLIEEIRTHPHQEEVLTLMQEQLHDDIEFCSSDDMV